MTIVAGWHNHPAHNMKGFLDGLIDDNEKGASSKKNTQPYLQYLGPKWPKLIPCL